MYLGKELYSMVMIYCNYLMIYYGFLIINWYYGLILFNDLCLLNGYYDYLMIIYIMDLYYLMIYYGFS